MSQSIITVLVTVFEQDSSLDRHAPSWQEIQAELRWVLLDGCRFLRRRLKTAS